METIDTIMSRKATRAYLDKDIDDSIIRELIETAAFSPSYGSTQPWKVYVAKGEKLDKLRYIWKERMSNASNLTLSNLNQGVKPDVPGPDKESLKHLPEFFENTDAWLKHRLKDTGLTEKEHGEILGNGATSFYGAPVCVFLGVSKYASKYSYYDLGAFSHTMMLAAKDKGINSLPAFTNVMYGDVLHKELGIPADINVLIGICLGYEDKESIMNKPRSKHLPIDEYLKIVSE
ncbi:hypothetical protein GNF18_07570 [Ligilactobacillus pobuzihii]|uniref:nitroreductase n=1 Tax=Ligilactobacillus pobuzihii TaxID=449659 RepID=UPI0019CFD5D4|nr:nitroreductase [Ligilactobacillus pobuzihii]MBN7274993.1 hypothetical protein [Ligilactobacillus pobuzihii]